VTFEIDIYCGSDHLVDSECHRDVFGNVKEQKGF
jgi:hypothetical protein